MRERRPRETGLAAASPLWWDDPLVDGARAGLVLGEGASFQRNLLLPVRAVLLQVVNFHQSDAVAELGPPHDCGVVAGRERADDR